MYDTAHFTRDAATARFDTDADGIIETEDGDTEFVWDNVEIVRVENPPHAEAFDTKRFYRLPATVARPIPQPYQYGEDTVWLKKPREELKRAAWSLDNAPWTMGHPDTGMVKNVDDVRGFWNDTHYIDSTDDLDSALHVPVDDAEAKEYVEENGDVSVGFHNRVARTDDYDGIVGGADDDDVDLDGFQTDMLFDHCASVRVGRCPSSEGCGIDAAGGHGHMSVSNDSGAFKSGTRITGSSDASEGDSMDFDGGTHDGTYYAVSPSENPDDEWKYPIDSCSDVSDAWQLRTEGDISISVDTLEDRIKSKARDLGCDVPDGETDSLDGLTDAADRYEIAPDMQSTDCGASSDCGCDDDTDSNTMDIDFDDLSADAALAKVAEQHDDVAERLDELRSAQDTVDKAEEAADELDSSVDNLPEAVGTLKDTNGSLRERVDELEEPKKEEHAEYITERTDRFGDKEDLIEEDLDDLKEKRDLVEDLHTEADDVTANAGGSEESESKDFSADGGYAKTPW